MRRIATALVLSLLAGSTALAQDNSAEYSRATGGEIQLLVKQPKNLSGSLGMSLSQSNSPFGSAGNLKGYSGTIGGTVVQDRLWFFASAERSEALEFASAMPQVREITPSALGKVTAQLGDRQTLMASVSRTEAISPLSLTAVPQSFLSMHYTGMISNNSFFTVNVSQSVARR